MLGNFGIYSTVLVKNKKNFWTKMSGTKDVGGDCLIKTLDVVNV